MFLLTSWLIDENESIFFSLTFFIVKVRINYIISSSIAQQSMFGITRSNIHNKVLENARMRNNISMRAPLGTYYIGNNI